MARETLPGWPTDWEKKKSFREKLGDRIWALLQGKEEKTELTRDKNSYLIEQFHENYDEENFYYRYSYWSDGRWDYVREQSRVSIDFWSLKAVKWAMEKWKLCRGDGRRIVPGHSYIKIWRIMETETLDDLEYVFKNMYLSPWVHIVFPWQCIRYQAEIQHLMKYLLGGEWCCFEFCWRFDDNIVKKLIKWFTWQWKKGKFKDCVIKINNKEYHSAWDYGYEFNK